MFTNKDTLEKNKIPQKQQVLISLDEASRELGLKNKEAVLYLMRSKFLTKGVYKINRRTIKINLPEFLENFKQANNNSNCKDKPC